MSLLIYKKADNGKAQQTENRTERTVAGGRGGHVHILNTKLYPVNMGSSEEFSGEILVGLTLRTMSWVAVCIVGPRRENRGGCTGTQTWVLVSSVRMGVMMRHQCLGEASSHRTGCRRNWRITIRARSLGGYDMECGADGLTRRASLAVKTKSSGLGLFESGACMGWTSHTLPSGREEAW